MPAGIIDTHGNAQKTSVDIILPNRIGDMILTLPAMLCLKQLEARHTPGKYGFRLLAHLPMIQIIRALNLFDVEMLSFSVKAKSWLAPADKAYFLSTTSNNIGLHAKTTYGFKMPHKKLVRYKVNLPYLSIPNLESALPEELIAHLRNSYRLTDYSIRQFGICLDLGYSVEQIKETFRFDSECLFPDGDFFDWKPSVPSGYIVFCMEAASGRKKGNSDRRWKEEYFFDLAEKVHREYGLQVAFMGISRQPELPARPYFLDFRNSLDLKQSALLLYYSFGYVGNDTGPLHLANLMKIKSIGMYFREAAVVGYSPIFPQYNRIFYKPQSPEEIYTALEELCSESVGRSTAV